MQIDFDPSKLDLEGFKSATELSKQLMTLSTGILAVSITFIKDIVKDNNAFSGLILRISWAIYFLSIICGIWTLMSITGDVFLYRCDPKFFQCPLDFPKVQISDNKLPLYPSNVQLFSLLQILTFLIATVLLIFFGAKTLKNMVKPTS